MKIIQSEIKVHWYTIEVLEDGMVSLHISDDYGFASKDDIKQLIKDLQKSIKKGAKDE